MQPRLLHRISDDEPGQEAVRRRAPLLFLKRRRGLVAGRDLKVDLHQPALFQRHVTQILDQRAKPDAHDRVRAFTGDLDGVDELRRRIRGNAQQRGQQQIVAIRAIVSRSQDIRLRRDALMNDMRRTPSRQKPPLVGRWWPVFGFLTVVNCEFVYSWQLPLQSRSSAAV